MTKKMILLNASPRKNKNTAQMLESVMKGAQEAGAECELIHLTSLNYKGCVSCFACKRTGNTCGGLCIQKDDLRPVLEKILEADALVVGSPIKYLDKRMPTAVVYTMNMPSEYYNVFNYHIILEPVCKQMEAFFGSCEQLEARNTWQFFPDYSKYDAKAVDVNQKQWIRDNQWPKDLQAAYELGKRMIENAD